MKTAEKLYDKYKAKTGQVVNYDSFIEALAEHDKEIKDIIPSTFYAGLELEERLKMLVSAWQRAIEVNHQLQKKVDGLGNKIENILRQFDGLNVREPIDLPLVIALIKSASEGEIK